MRNKYWVVVLLVLAFLLLWLLVTRCPRPAEAEEYPYLPWITEVVPQPAEGQAPAIELHNPTGRAVDAAGLRLVVNDAYEYSLPAQLPPVPAGGFVVVRFDGKGAEANDYRYAEGVATLHAPPGFEHAFARPQAPGTGHIAVYQPEAEAAPGPVGFVAWGRPATLESLTAARARIWGRSEFVRTRPSFGDYDPAEGVSESFSIGLSPDSRSARRPSWSIYAANEATLGALNAVPRPALFTLANGAEVLSEDIAVGWTGQGTARRFQFQLATDPDFTDIVEDRELDRPVYRPESVLPEGEYFYRVRALGARGKASAWSDTRSVVSKAMAGAGVDGAIVEKVLAGMVHKHQRKDTGLLCLDGCPSDRDPATVKQWHVAHPDAEPSYGDHGDMNCVRASVAMMVSFYGMELSQDRISYYTQEERPGASAANGIPEGDLAHGDGMSYPTEETETLEWALDAAVDWHDSNPSFADLQGWLDDDRPIMTRRPGHLRTMNGYRIDDDDVEWVHILDPWSGPRWETYATWNGEAHGTWVGPVAAPTAREDEPTIATDSDGDGVMDFDEEVRFGTGPFDNDNDNDDVEDRNDLQEYVFDASDDYSKRGADFDADATRKEADPDNDADGYSDGCEDTNFNGTYEPGLGETDNFSVDADLTCATKPIHAIIVFDRSGSMVVPSSDPVKKYEQAGSAAVLFLDTWLANDPPALTKVGLVFYDNTAYFDDDPSRDTRLALLDENKRNLVQAALDENWPDYGSTSIGSGLLAAAGDDGFDVDDTPADDQHRVVVVLTDGIENTPPYMDDPTVTSALADGEIDGYVLGIGNESQIDMDQLEDLATILNHPPASFAKDLAEFEIEKFFLQVLAETQGLEFSEDPVGSISVGEAPAHQVVVSAGTERVTFVVAWRSAGVELDVSLEAPDGTAATPDSSKDNRFYKVLTKDSPVPGAWTVRLGASPRPGGGATSNVPYAVMALEKNRWIKASFQVLRGLRFAERPLLLVADLSRGRTPLTKARVRVRVERPALSAAAWLADLPLPIPKLQALSERWPDGAAADPPRLEALALADRGLTLGRLDSEIWLNDRGLDGDEVPGDGRYSASFRDTPVDGLYRFTFVLDDGVAEVKTPTLTRHGSVTTYLKTQVIDVAGHRQRRSGEER